MKLEAPVTFETVLKAELEHLKERRVRLQPQSTDAQEQDSTPTISKDETKIAVPIRDDSVYEDALKSDLCGLAISGGGIRSATFALGIIQGLAANGLLQRFDYLSTVSGGGYIGSWLAAWIHRAGLKKVLAALQPPRFLKKAAFESMQRAAQLEHQAHEANPLAQYGQRSAPPVTSASPAVRWWSRKPATKSATGKSRQPPPADNDQGKTTAVPMASGAVGGNGDAAAADVVAKATAPSSGVNDLPKGLWVEPSPIRHLRFYSNYLAPRLGIFSVDGWVLIAIYLRNLLLNQMVLLLAVTAAFLLAMAIVELFSAYRNPVESGFSACFAAITAVISLLVALTMTIVCSFRERTRAVEQPTRQPIDLFWPFAAICGSLVTFRISELLAIVLAALGVVLAVRIIFPSFRQQTRAVEDPKRQPLELYWLLAAFCGSLLFVTDRSQKWFGGATLLGAMCVSVAVIHAALASSAFVRRDSKERFGDCGIRGLCAVVLSFIAGAIAGLVLYGLLFAMIEMSTKPLVKVATFVTFGPPLFLLCYVLGNFLQIGLSRVCYEAYEREWWSSLNARLLRISAAWLLGMGLTVFGTWSVALMLREAWRGFPAIAALITWGTTTGAGLWAARSAQTGFLGPNWKDRLARIAPVIFLIGLLLIVAFSTTWLCYEVHAIVSRAHLDFFGDYINKQSGALLYELETETLPLFPWRHFPYTGLAHTPISGFLALVIGFAIGVVLWLVVGTLIGVNAFSLHDLYALRLVRCYLGASNVRRRADPLINLDSSDDLKLSDLQDLSEKLTEREHKEERYDGPLVIINGALNRKVGELVPGQEAASLAFQDRKAESFFFTPYFTGAISTGFVPTHSFANDVRLGTAMAISGAAVSPNMGFHSSPAVTAFLTVFNMRLGAWLGNPRKGRYGSTSPSASYLLAEMLGITGIDREFVYVSDGGHFENTGVYELVRRRCRFILVIDSGADSRFLRENLGHLVRKVRIDLGIRIEIDVEETRPLNGFAKTHVAVGRIFYNDVHEPGSPMAPGDPQFNYQAGHGMLVYLKVGLTGDEPADLLNFQAENPLFPNESTLDQFYSESQFESYRAVGLHTALQLIENVLPRSPSQPLTNRGLFERLFVRWMPRPPGLTTEYLECNEKYAALQEKLRSDKNLQLFAWELCGNKEQRRLAADKIAEENRADAELAERLMLVEMMTLLENTYFSLALDRHLYHPYNIGWWRVLYNWKQTSVFERYWKDIENEFSGVFREFIRELGQPPVDVADRGITKSLVSSPTHA
jgi:hypothetical protein